MPATTGTKDTAEVVLIRDQAHVVSKASVEAIEEAPLIPTQRKRAMTTAPPAEAGPWRAREVPVRHLPPAKSVEVIITLAGKQFMRLTPIETQ